MARIPASLISRAIDTKQRASALIGLLEDDAARRVAQLAERTINEAIALAQDYRGDLLELVLQIEQMLDAASAGGANIMAMLADDVFDISLSASVDTMQQFGTMSPRAAIAAAQQFDGAYRYDLISESWQNWYTRIQESALSPASGLRDAVESVAVRGGDLRGAVKRMIEDDPILEGLPKIKQNIGIEARAMRVVRTESARIDNATSVGFAEASGVNEFVNIGVGDTRQSDECKEASKAPAMTLDRWRATHGVAPRHPNCRCIMMGVPGEYDPSDDLLREAGVI